MPARLCGCEWEEVSDYLDSPLAFSACSSIDERRPLLRREPGGTMPAGPFRRKCTSVLPDALGALKGPGRKAWRLLRFASPVRQGVCDPLSVESMAVVEL